MVLPSEFGRMCGPQPCSYCVVGARCGLLQGRLAGLLSLICDCSICVGVMTLLQVYTYKV